ncbi:MAG TPA: hypothetical protein VEZ14_02520 [Dehalococcoidia bacterium]|nr:hypothetical protein [Dehalococcoidia bacterium]
MTRSASRRPLAAAALLIGLQAAFDVLVALVLFASGRRLERWTLATRVAHHRLGLGLAVLVIAAIGVAIAVAVASGAGWARIAAYVFEGFTVVGALFRIGLHPLPSIFSVALAMAVVVLIAGWDEEAPAAAETPVDSGTAATSN